MAVAQRLDSAGSDAGVSGAVRDVLAAVIELLPRRWKRIRDDRVQLSQLVELCPTPHHPRTIGRGLAKLATLQLITYAPAQGRGRAATIAVHPRLLGGIDELNRDAAGRVVVPFSRRRPYINQDLYPPTPRHTQTPPPNRSRPVEVEVSPDAVRQVFAEMPTVFQALPKSLRWLLGRAIRDKLARGWPPTAILAVLAAPLPAVVGRPYRLALWRLAQNLIGAGPRLAPLQRAYDERAATQRRRQDDQTWQRAYERVHAATTADQRAAMLDTLIGRLSLNPAAIDPERAVVQASRIATREHPQEPLADAITIWLKEHPVRPAATPAAATGTREGLHWLSGTTTGACVSCGRPGLARDELPLRSVVCGSCWATTTEKEAEAC